MMRYYLDFERPIEDLELKMDELKRISDGKDIDLSGEIKKLEKKIRDLRSEIFSSLTPWQKTLIARHPDRPYTLDYINLFASDFIELHGDRRFADDPAIVAGLAKVNGIPVVHRRAPERTGHKGEDIAQLRTAASGGIPEGIAGDEACGEIQKAGDYIDRYPRRLSRNRSGRKRAG